MFCKVIGFGDIEIRSDSDSHHTSQTVSTMTAATYVVESNVVNTQEPFNGLSFAERDWRV